MPDAATAGKLRRGQTADRRRQDLVARGIDHDVIAQGPEQVGPEEARAVVGGGYLRHDALGRVFAQFFNIRVVAGEAETGGKFLDGGYDR